MGAAVRAVAARVVRAVIDNGESLDTALQRELGSLPTDDGPLCKELSYGTLRYEPRLAWFAARLLRQQLAANARDVHALLLIGLYQLEILATPAHVAVSTTVEACRQLGQVWACGLVNGTLRNYQRRQIALRAEADDSPAARFAHPLWIVDAARKHYPADWQSLLTANNSRPPMTLRVNLRATSRDLYMQRLATAGIRGVTTVHSPCGVTIASPVGVSNLPGFDQGEVSVQDEAAQFAASLLDPLPGQRVLDACAAPGGKSAHLLEAQPLIAEMVALDSDADRLARLNSTLDRLHLTARVQTGDAMEPQSWWDGRRFDRILLDAPCSATGVIRRHPDIKQLRRPSDIPALAAMQRRMLGALWPLLARGGKLLYSTCSIFPEENSLTVQDFLAATPDAAKETIAADWGHVAPVGRQILPGEENMDGFYYALLVKR
jgi:16S rRNA (cytosine967-C5)-methyltransferase